MQRNRVNTRCKKLEKYERCKGRLLKRFRGVTITEVVIATALLGAAIVPMLKALTTSHLNDKIIERKSRSIMLAQSRLEQIRAESIYNFEDSFDDITEPEENYICNVSDDGDSNLKQITVSVGYDDNDNGILEDEEINITLNTYIARRY